MVLTPDDIMDGLVPEGPVVVYDDDHYYMGGVIAEELKRMDLGVTLVTPANEVSTWTRHTEEQHRIQQRILRLGIHLETGSSVAAVDEGSVTLESVHTGDQKQLEAAGVVMVTSRSPVDGLYRALAGRVPVQRIGDCLAPGTIAAAVYSGHRAAREMDAAAAVGVPFRRE
jgi:dimethylamine/trimethylamine dehydrogenase